jgi:hypothetical protein
MHPQITPGYLLRIAYIALQHLKSKTLLQMEGRKSRLEKKWKIWCGSIRVSMWKAAPARQSNCDANNIFRWSLDIQVAASTSKQPTIVIVLSPNCRYRVAGCSFYTIWNGSPDLWYRPREVAISTCHIFHPRPKSDDEIKIQNWIELA